MPHCFITPQHIVIKPGEKDHQMFDASQKYDWDSVPVDHMTSKPYGSKLHCKFGSIRKDILICIYNLHISYPKDNIVIHANDIKSCFCQIKHHPDIVWAFSYILSNYLFFNYSPSNWESVRQVQFTLATQLFHNALLVLKHRTILDQIQWCHSL